VKDLLNLVVCLLQVGLRARQNGDVMGPHPGKLDGSSLAKACCSASNKDVTAVAGDCEAAQPVWLQVCEGIKGGSLKLSENNKEGERGVGEQGEVIGNCSEQSQTQGNKYSRKHNSNSLVCDKRR